MYINHLTLTTGHTSRIQRGDVTGETLARVAPWLAVATATGGRVPLPVAGLADYSALAETVEGSLVLTVLGPPKADMPPLVTVGVAKRSRHSSRLWAELASLPGAHVKAGLVPPADPWCGVLLWPSLAHDPTAAHWIGDFERCVAWAWCTRPEDGPA